MFANMTGKLEYLHVAESCCILLDFMGNLYGDAHTEYGVEVPNVCMYMEITGAARITSSADRAKHMRLFARGPFQLQAIDFPSSVKSQE